MKKITTQEFTLRPADKTDAPILTAWWNDGVVMAHAGFPYGLGQSLAETEAQLVKGSELNSTVFIIEQNGLPIGECSCTILETGEVEIGIKLCVARAQNHGLGTRVLETLTRYLFTDSELNQSHPIKAIVLDTNLNNKRAQHVYEKLGFVKTGEAHDNWTNQRGELQSTVYYDYPRDKFMKDRRLSDPFA